MRKHFEAQQGFGKGEEVRLRHGFRGGERQRKSGVSKRLSLVLRSNGPNPSTISSSKVFIRGEGEEAKQGRFRSF